MHICKQHTLNRSLINLSPLCNLSDPDSVAFCVLATDEEYECDIALQIHFTLIQAFCFDNDINIVRVNDIECLADIVGSDQDEEPKDVHCILVTVSSSTPLYCIYNTYTLSTPTFALHLHDILISLLFSPKEPQCWLVERFCSWEIGRVLWGEPQCLRMGAYYYSARALIRDGFGTWMKPEASRRHPS